MSGSANRIITIRNAGSANLTGISLSLIGSNTADFFFGTVATGVAAGQQTTFTLTFSAVPRREIGHPAHRQH